MTGGAVSLLVALGVCLALSAFFSASETAFSSLNRIRMKSLAAQSPKAARTLALAEKYDQLLSTVLVGNNIVNILSSSLATVLFVGWMGNAGVTVATITMTLLVLIFGEITPKTMAKEAPERFAMAVTPVLRVLVILLTPVNALLSAWKRLVLRLFRFDSRQGATEEELLTYVEEVREDGAISEKEEDMIRSVIEFDDLQAVEICTPRVDVKAIDITDSVKEIAAAFHETNYSRMPVYRDSIDNVMGILLEKDFHYYVEGMGEPVENVLRPALFTTKTVKISRLLAEFQEKKLHMAVILDEYGGTVGILTIEDILEELVGEIWDEHDEIEEDVEELGDGRYRIHGGAPLDVLARLYGLGEIESSAITVGGWCLEALGHIPQDGEEFRRDTLHIVIDEMRRNRVFSVVAEPDVKLPEMI